MQSTAAVATDPDEGLNGPVRDISRKTITAALDGVGHGVIVINANADVMLINHPARFMLQLQDHPSEGASITSVLSASPLLNEVDVATLVKSCVSVYSADDVPILIGMAGLNIKARVRSLAGHHRALFLEPVVMLGRSEGDRLTGLADRRGLLDGLHSALQADQHEGGLVVVAMDLGRFQQINDTLGHQVGDGLLQIVAARLRNSLRTGDIAARLTSDEFAICARVGGDRSDVGLLARRLLHVTGQHYSVNGHLIHVETRAGLALAPEHGAAPDLLLRRAMLALRQAKLDGREVCRFDLSIQARAEARRGLELDLRNALGLRQFDLFYQPLVDIGSGRLCGFEALIRWRHPTRGLVGPGEFIPLAEEIGLISEIGAWVVDEACCEAARWPDTISLSVNASSAQFEDGTLVATIANALARSGLPGRRLELEVTETALLRSGDATRTTLRELRAMGVRIAMDDFGTGYSSLTQLQSFPFDKLKIDRSFVSRIGGAQDSMPIVRAIARMGASLGLRTVAEGVETQEQMRVLRAEGCDEAQGFLLSRPVPVEQIDTILRSFAAT